MENKETEDDTFEKKRVCLFYLESCKHQRYKYKYPHSWYFIHYLWQYVMKNDHISVEKYCSFMAGIFICWESNLANYDLLSSTLSFLAYCFIYFASLDFLFFLFFLSYSYASAWERVSSLMMKGFFLWFCYDFESDSRISRPKCLNYCIYSLQWVCGLDNVSLWSRAECVSLKVNVFLGVGRD